jgi:hypothetical protein
MAKFAEAATPRLPSDTGDICSQMMNTKCSALLLSLLAQRDLLAGLRQEPFFEYWEVALCRDLYNVLHLSY